MTAVLILAVVLAPSAVFAAHRLWVTRGRSPEERRDAYRAELARRLDTAARIDQLYIKGE
ncbi:hypothetical protein [Streptomyces sp. NPDC005969]|uniref:hypothetical protein n=1 Tax=Streptomyces sp. NPDC005969 TaxID=3156722 RepID=UPI0033DC62A6